MLGLDIPSESSQASLTNPSTSQIQNHSAQEQNFHPRQVGGGDQADNYNLALSQPQDSCPFEVVAMNDADLKEYQLTNEMMDGHNGSNLLTDEQQHSIPERMLDNGMAQELRVASQEQEQDDSEQK